MLDHCPNLTEIDCLWLDEGDDLDKLPNLCRIEGLIGIDAELSLEQLKAKLPNLKNVTLEDGLSPEYITEFCGAFPLLIELRLPQYEQEEKLSEEYVNAISSLQHLRILVYGNFTDEQTHTIIGKLPNLEELDLCYHPGLSSQTLLSISRMSKLKLLGINVETVMGNMDLFTHEFSMLKKLELYGDSAEADAFTAGFEFANSGSKLVIDIL